MYPGLLRARASQGNVKLVSVVRDPQGRPRFDDPHNVPQEILDVLTEEDLKYLAALREEKS